MASEDRSWAAVAAPGLALAVPFFVFTSHNGYPWTSPALWLAGAVVVLPGLVLGALGQAGGFRTQVAALAVGVALAVELHLRSSSSAEKAGSAVVAMLVVAGLAAALRERVFPTFALLLGMFLLTTPLAQVGAPLVTEQIRAGAAARTDLPPIIHLILDEQAGVDAIPEEADPAGRLRTALRDGYAGDGFRVYTRAYSRYYDSYNSIPNVLNLSSPPVDSAHLRADGDEESRILLENDYFRRMAQRGYRLRVYQSSYMDFTQSTDAPVDYAFTYQIHSVGTLAGLPAPVTQRATLLFTSFTQWKTLPGAVAVPAVAALRRMTADLAARDNRGTLTFAHITLPHYTYLFDEHCRAKPALADWVGRRARKGLVENSAEERSVRYKAYVDQALCADSLVDELIGALRAKGDWEDALVVVHGDHGSRITTRAPYARNQDKLTPQDQRDAFATFLAVKAPGLAAGASEAPLAVQDALAILLDGHEPEVPPPTVFIGPTKGKFAAVPFTGFGAP